MPRLPDPERAARRRREILEAALVCFRRRGFHQATMQEICAEARVSPGALYRYFASKTDIIAAIAAEEHAQMEPLFRSIADGQDFLSMLRILAQEWLNNFATENAPLIADVIAECVRDRDLANRINGDSLAIQMHFAGAIRAAQERGEVDADIDPVAAVRLINATLDGLGMRVALLRDVDVETAADEFLVMISRYLAPRPEAARSHPQKKTARMKTAGTAQETV